MLAPRTAKPQPQAETTASSTGTNALQRRHHPDRVKRPPTLDRSFPVGPAAQPVRVQRSSDSPAQEGPLPRSGSLVIGSSADPLEREADHLAEELTAPARPSSRREEEAVISRQLQRAHCAPEPGSFAEWMRQGPRLQAAERAAREEAITQQVERGRRAPEPGSLAEWMRQGPRLQAAEKAAQEAAIARHRQRELVPGSLADRIFNAHRERVPVSASPAVVGHVQRACSACEAEESGEEGVVSRKEKGGAAPAMSDAPALVHSVLRSGGGAPLDPATRADFERRLGIDLGTVRVHTGAQAAESAQAIHARAYTSGSNVVFGAGQYSPQSSEGKRLLAHELAHVQQQASGAGPSVVQRQSDEDHCGPIRSIAYTYRVAVQERRMEDARKLLSQASKEEAAYLHCRLTAPGDALAKFARAEISDNGVTVATNQLKRKLGVPEVAVHGTEKPKTGGPTTQEEYDRLHAEVLTGLALGSPGFIVKNDDDFLDYAYRPTYKQESGGWSKWIVFLYPDGTVKEVHFDAITPNKPNQWGLKQKIQRMWAEDLLRITRMSADASMFVVSATMALRNPLGSRWAARGSPGVVRIPGLRGNLYEPQTSTVTANESTPFPASTPEVPSSLTSLVRAPQPLIRGPHALDMFARPGAFAAPLEDVAPFSLKQPFSMPRPGALDVALTPTRFFQAPGSQLGAPLAWTAGSMLPTGTMTSVLSPVAQEEVRSPAATSGATPAVTPITAAAPPARTPVMPSGLSPADQQLWSTCNQQHNTYKATQEAAAAIAARMAPIADDLQNNRGSPQDRITLCSLLDELIQRTQRERVERLRYIAWDCDRFDWYNEGRTAAERLADHQGHLILVGKNLGNLYSLRGKLCQ